MSSFCDRRSLGQAVAIVLFGCVVGLGVNHHVLTVAPPTPVAPPTVTAPAVPYPLPVTLPEVRELLAAGALAVDARPRALFNLGHLPMSRSIPFEEFVTLPQRLAGLLPADRPLLIYCSGFGCRDSFDLAQLLIAAGYRDVRVFEDGFPAWRDAGLPVATGETR